MPLCQRQARIIRAEKIKASEKFKVVENR